MNSKNIDLLKKFDLAIKEHQLGNHEQEKKLYRKILTIDSNHFESNFYLGTLYAQSNNLNEALSLLNKAKEINPKVEDVHNNLGLIYKQLGEYKSAIDYLLKAIKPTIKKISKKIAAARGKTKVLSVSERQKEQRALRK